MSMSVCSVLPVCVYRMLRAGYRSKKREALKQDAQETNARIGRVTGRVETTPFPSHTLAHTLTRSLTLTQRLSLSHDLRHRRGKRRLFDTLTLTHGHARPARSIAMGDGGLT